MNLKLFKKRLNALYSCWRKYKKELWANSEILVICTPPTSCQPNPISTHFYTWLMGHKFDDTIVIFTFTTIYFLCHKNKVSLLQSLVSPALESVQAKVLVYPKGKGDDGLAILDKLINTTMVADWAQIGERRPFVIGSVSGECPRSQILGRCSLGINWSKYQNVSINIGLGSLFNVSSRDARAENLEREGNYVPDKIQMQSLPENFEHLLPSEGQLQFGVKNQVQVGVKNQVFEQQIKKCNQLVVEDSLERFEEYFLVDEEMEKEDQSRVYSMENSQESLECSLVSKEYDHDWVLVE